MSGVVYPRFGPNDVVGLDLETYDPLFDTFGPSWPFQGQGFIAGYALAWGPEGQRETAYYPVRHEGGGNLPAKATERFIKDVTKSGCTLVVHNALYEKGWMRRADIPMRGTVYDTLTAAPILDEYRFSYSLNGLAKEMLGRTKNEERLMAYGFGRKVPSPKTGRMVKEFRTKGQVKGNLWRFPASEVAAYGAEDALDALDLWDIMRPQLHEQNCWRLFDIETRLIDILVEMRWRGVRVRTNEVEAARVSLAKQRKALQSTLDTAAGFHVDVNDPALLMRAFALDGIKPLKTKTGKDSFRKGWLDTVDSRFGRMVNAVRRIDKADGTFLKGYVLDKQWNGRVHCQFTPQKSDEGGAVTGRFSSSLPNLQNLPARDKEIKRLVRGAFLPEPGEEWAACDYSQQEPRLTVHFAVKGKIVGATKAQRAYIDNPDMDYHQFMADICHLPRDQTKPINLGVGYGMGGAKLCRSLGLPTKFIERPERDRKGNLIFDLNGDMVMVKIEVAGDEGQAILKAYHQNAPFVKGLSDDCMKRAKVRGHVKTLLGRRCRFSNGANGWGRQDWYYKAMNRLIQGSAADQTKLAMLDCWEAGYVPLVTVHDELGFSVSSRSQARHIAELMAHCVELEVPSKVDVELGPSWGEASENLPDLDELDAAA